MRSNIWWVVLVAGCGGYDHGKDPYELDSYVDVPTDVAGDQFEDVGDNPWVETEQSGVSTFALDVDSASYTIMRSDLQNGRLPDPASVRTEEYVNYFRYDDIPSAPDQPFNVSLELAPSVFGPEGRDAHLLRIGVQADQVEPEERLHANLIFLIDVSGSMNQPDKLGLVKYALAQLVDRLELTDTLGIVVYAGADAVLLDPTEVSDKPAILAAIDQLTAGGSTAGAAGLRTAYQLAQDAFDPDGINRVVLCTDGDFNVGMTGEALIEQVEQRATEGIFLTTLGFGRGNLNDAFIEDLTNRGNGNYAFIDGRDEALRVLGQHLVSTLQVVAKDAKIQVHFDAASVAAWRLIGYENRLLEEDEFDDDTVDGGDVGAGHTVTALYELELADGAVGLPIAEVDVRYKQPDEDVSTELNWSIDGSAMGSSFERATPALRMSAAVAEFAEILGESPHSTGARFEDIHAITSAAYPESERSRVKAEFLSLVTLADELWP